MALSLDLIDIGAPRVEAAHAFYSSAFSAVTEDGVDDLDLHGSGRLAVHRVDAPTAEPDVSEDVPGFHGCVLSAIVGQPAEVRALLDAATAQGAAVVKPPKKQLFGEYTAVYRAPDGALWKLAASTKKDKGQVPSPPKPTETAVYLGVAEPKTSREFYEALGMSVRHDYGSTFVDFTTTDTGTSRLGLLTRKALAKDIGVEDTGVDGQGDGFPALVLTHTATSPQDVDTLLAAVEPAGGRITAGAARTDRGDYAGGFTDPDGFRWRVTAAE